jgi:hypothetical protein
MFCYELWFTHWTFLHPYSSFRAMLCFRAMLNDSEWCMTRLSTAEPLSTGFPFPATQKVLPILCSCAQSLTGFSSCSVSFCRHKHAGRSRNLGLALSFVGSNSKAIRTHWPLYLSSIRSSQQDSLLYTQFSRTHPFSISSSLSTLSTVGPICHFI